MGFSEQVKEQVRKLSNGICVICKREVALEVHHLIPQKENGGDAINNAVPLCANCHEIYGSNPTKRKLIRQLRDHWYQRVKQSSNNIEDLIRLHADPNVKEKKVGIYHVVYEHETFEDAASTLFGLVSETQKKFPGTKRILYLDIDGHRNKIGGYDRDMFELQCEFSLGFLLKYLSEIYMPLAKVVNNVQRNNIPEKFKILSSEEDKKSFMEKIEGKTVFMEEDV